jgi:hypothetical protein
MTFNFLKRLTVIIIVLQVCSTMVIPLMPVSTVIYHQLIMNNKVPCFGRTLSRWSPLHLQLLAPTNPHWTRMVVRLFSLCVIHKEDLCPSNGDINRLMMMSKHPSQRTGTIERLCHFSQRSTHTEPPFYIILKPFIP